MRSPPCVRTLQNIGNPLKKHTITPLALIDLSEVEDLYNAQVPEEEISQCVTGIMQPSLPHGLNLSVLSVDGPDMYATLRDGMTGVEVDLQIDLAGIGATPAQIMQVLGEFELAAASAETGLVHVPFARRSQKRNARAVLGALQTRDGAGVGYVGTKSGVAIFRMPGAFIGAPIFGIDMKAAYEWKRLFDAQFGAA